MSASPIADWERHRKTVAVTVILAALLYFGVAVYSGWQEVWSAAVVSDRRSSASWHYRCEHDSDRIAGAFFNALKPTSMAN